MKTSKLSQNSDAIPKLSLAFPFVLSQNDFSVIRKINMGENNCSDSHREVTNVWHRESHFFFLTNSQTKYMVRWHSVSFHLPELNISTQSS